MKKKQLSKNHISIVVVIILLLFVGMFAVLEYQKNNLNSTEEKKVSEMTDISPEVQKTAAEWKEILSPQQYYVLREGGTDRPFDPNDPLLHEKRKGTYVTADCGEPVFRSEQKFDSGTGWPSFWAPIEGSVVEKVDNTLGITRTEIVGKKCGGHLGHVFTDGPEPTGLRYCINSSALKFIPDEE